MVITTWGHVGNYNYLYYNLINFFYKNNSIKYNIPFFEYKSENKTLKSSGSEYGAKLTPYS